MKLKASAWIRWTGIAICLMAFLNLNSGKDHWRGIPEADARGYYAWLPALCIYHDLHFGFMDSIEGKKYFDPNLYYEYRVGYEDKVINKYFAGTAFAQLPFFLMAHAWAGMSGEDQDGYSKPYMMMIGIAALFWLMTGLYWADKWMQVYRLSEFSRALALGGFLFGTNLFYYAVVEPGMSHVYSFAMFSGVLYLFKSYQIQNKFPYLLCGCFLWSLALAVRPVNIIFIFALPFVFGGLKPLKEVIPKGIQKPGRMALILMAWGFFPFIQMALHAWQTGIWGIWSYPGEAFDFFNPQWINILFSYKKGLFLYTPLYFIAIVLALLSAFKKEPVRASGWYLVFWGIQVWVFSSWWSWWYGGSFSGRPFLDFGAPILLFLAVGLEWMHQRISTRILASMILIALVAFCQFQIYQYRYYLIHWEDMNQEKYWSVFLKLP
jgi:hypothetical protein